MTVAVLLAGALAVAGVLLGVWLGRRDMERAERIAGHAESERAWLDFSRREGIPHGAAASKAWAIGEEFYCRCGCREVVRKGSPPPSCDGVSCVGAEHEARVMRSVAAPWPDELPEASRVDG